MSIAKVIEVIAEGDSIENAVDNALSEAAKTVHGISGVWVQDIKGLVEDNKVTTYRVNVKITFVLKDDM